MLKIRLNEEGEVVEIGGNARTGDIKEKGLLKASMEWEEKK